MEQGGALEQSSKRATGGSEDGEDSAGEAVGEDSQQKRQKNKGRIQLGGIMGGTYVEQGKE
jgi:hypothetical protein